MSEQDWGRWQVILGIIGIIITVGGLIHSDPSIDIDPDPEPKLTPPQTPTPTTGNISVASSPSGASIYLDGMYQGTTPMILNNIEQGSHTISLKLEGYEEYSQTANVDANKQTAILAILPSNEKQSSLGSISVNSNPVGASVSLDGVYKGETPKNLENIEQGSHVITLELAEYDSWTQTVSVDPGETLPLSPTLTKTIPEVTQDPSAKIESVWLEPDFWNGNVKGVRIHIEFSTENLEDEECLSSVLFYDSLSGYELIDSDGYYAINGQVAVWEYFTPEYVDSSYNDFTLFIPYDQFHYTGQGTAYVKYQVIISSEDEILDYSDWYTYSFIKYY